MALNAETDGGRFGVSNSGDLWISYLVVVAALGAVLELLPRLSAGAMQLPTLAVGVVAISSVLCALFVI